jgi:DNA-binding beta-propeller fold protein YncE
MGMSMAQAGTRTYQYSHTIGIDDFSGRAFRCAVDLALGPQGMLYVLQRGTPVHNNVAVKICDVEEKFFGDFGSYGSGPGQWVWPAAIAIDSQQRHYVSDDWNQRISAFDTQGNLLDEWGRAGIGDGQLNRPLGIAFDHRENLLVVDSGRGRLKIHRKLGHS